MRAGVADPPASRVPVRAIATILTVVGVGGIWVNFLALFVASGRPVTGGCGGFGGVLAILVILTAAVLGFINVAAFTGIGLYWARISVGPAIAIAGNLFAIDFYGFLVPVDSGQLVWGLVLFSLAMTSALAVVLLMWPVLTLGSRRLRIAEVGALCVLALASFSIAAPGLATELARSFQAPTPPTVSVSCSSHATST